MTTGVNQFVPFATGVGANVITPTALAALAATSTGFQSGVAQSQQLNAVWRQSSFVASAIAQIIADTGVNANDDGNVAEFRDAFLTAMATHYPVVPPAFPSGTRIPFAQAAAPTGWTQDTSDNANNRMLRVVSSAGNGVGGTSSPVLNNVVPAHTHSFTTGNVSADHSHYVAGYTGGQTADHSHTAPSSPGLGQGAAGPNTVQQSGSTHQTYGTSNDHAHYFAAQSSGASGNHTHSGSTDNGSSQTNWTPRYIDLIICSKN